MFGELLGFQTKQYPHTKRHLYWSSVSPKVYGYDEGERLVYAYLNTVTEEIERIVSSHSRMYWLHLSRRVLPDTSGNDKSHITISITRRILDAAYQKYGLDKFCDSINSASRDNISHVLDGLLLLRGYQYEKEMLLQTPGQIVLTKFNPNNYIEYFELEKLAYEVWRCGAALRIIGKGANLVVDHKNNELFLDDRSSELDELLTNYDNRREPFLASKKGVVVTNNEDITSGTILVPMYNTTREKADFLKFVFDMCGISIELEGHMVSNFILIAYPIRAFYHNNRHLLSAFFEKHKVSVVSILSVVIAVCLKIMRELIVEKKVTIVESMFTRGYQGPFLESEIISSVESYQEDVDVVLQVGEEDKADIDTQSGYDFLRLNNPGLVNLLYPGPFKMLIPVEEGKVLIDLSKIVHILDGLMFDVNIKTENFKGTLLERAVGSKTSALPTNECIAKDNSRKQIDYAFPVNNILVIVECKLKAMSVGFVKGKKESINTRAKNVVKKSIEEVDNKAKWLASRPLGRNYSLSKYKYILPVGLSAYKEFIHTKDKEYWLSPDLPRVMTIYELEELKKNTKNDLLNYWNIVRIDHVKN